jgi:hypothetical protein
MSTLHLSVTVLLLKKPGAKETERERVREREREREEKGVKRVLLFLQL